MLFSSLLARSEEHTSELQSRPHLVCRLLLEDYLHSNLHSFPTRRSSDLYKEPFNIYKIKEVNVFTDYTYENKDLTFKDSTLFKNFNLFSYGKMRFKAKAITDAVFITPGEIGRAHV